MTTKDIHELRDLLADALEAAAHVIRQGSPEGIFQPDETPATSGTTKLLLTVAEAAERLSIGKSTVYELMNDGTLPTVSVGRSRRVPAVSLGEFVEARMTTSFGGIPRENVDRSI